LGRGVDARKPALSTDSASSVPPDATRSSSDAAARATGTGNGARTPEGSAGDPDGNAAAADGPDLAGPDEPPDAGVATGGCDRCDPVATCAAIDGRAECTCPRGYSGDGESCVFEDECATGRHGCGTLGGRCTNGAGLGYACACTAGFTLGSGTFPDCFRSGTVTFLQPTPGGIGDRAFDFSLGMPASITDSDFYLSTSEGVPTFFANNFGQNGVARVTSTAANLRDVPIPPASEFRRSLVSVVSGATYVALAETPEESESIVEPSELGYYIIFRVTAFDAASATLEYVYVYRP